MTLFDLSNDEQCLICNALEYFQRDVDDGEDLTSGGEPVASSEIDALLQKLTAPTLKPLLPVLTQSRVKKYTLPPRFWGLSDADAAIVAERNEDGRHPIG